MECLTDQFCLLMSVHDGLTQASLFVDQIGFGILGSEWQALTPRLEEHAEALLRLIGRVIPAVQPGSCDANLSGAIHV